MKKEDKNHRKGGFGRIVRRLLAAVGTLLLTGVLSVLIFACIFAVYVNTDLAKQVDFTVTTPDMNQTSTIYYRSSETGQWLELQKLYDEENRIFVTYDKLPQDLIDACIAIEDKRFLEHPGVDWITTAKASVRMFLGDASAGGSTITQQLIKNLTGRKEITVRRKIVEIFSALEYEKTHSKAQILELYMNVIYMGEGCYGVQSASQVYFGKPVSELTLAECASLIGITNNPSIFDPYISPEKNRERQLIILQQMLVQEKITQEEYDEAVAQEMVFTSESADDENVDDDVYYSYFVDQVIRDVIRDLAEKGGYSQDIAKKILYRGGYNIYCTMDPTVQQALEGVYEDLDNIPDTASSQQLQSAMVVVDNQSGDVVGIVGGVGKKSGSLDLSRATQSTLSPGSVIKPISVYSPALDLGIITPISVYDDSPLYFVEEEGYPKNQNGTYRGLVSVNYAVGQSLNTVAIKLVNQMGPLYSYNFAKEKMGLKTLVNNETINGATYTDAALAPMSMGGLTYGVTVRDLTTAYAALANSGVYRNARTYTHVTDADGRTILENAQEEHRAVSDKAAWYMTSMLQNATVSGTAVEAKLGGIAVAAKTGTTSSSKDRWFAGYTPYYTGVVWCGYDEPEEVILTGSSTNPALKLWKDVMTVTHQGLADRSFIRPAETVTCTYCQDSGLLATEACRLDPRGSRLVTGTLLAEDVPTESCGVHVPVEICTESGNAATEYCSQYCETRTVGLLQINRAYPVMGVEIRDHQYTTPMSNENVGTGYFLPKVPQNIRTQSYCPSHTQPLIPEDPVLPDEPWYEPPEPWYEPMEPWYEPMEPWYEPMEP